MKRVFHHYERLEEFTDGMWRITRGDGRKAHVEASAALMRDATAFEGAMLRALEEWPLSCEHNLSAENVNRIAWLGHAGCCVGAGSPEDCTRVAWHTLTQSEQDAANQAAANVLAQWTAANEPKDLFSWGDHGA
jgi:hypothetical protein